MAQWNEQPWRNDVYAAADICKERCLLNYTVLFNDKAGKFRADSVMGKPVDAR